MTNNSKNLRIIKEDVLRILGEKGNQTSLEVLTSKLEVSFSLLQKAIKELGERELTNQAGNHVKLTAKGGTIAEIICRKHNIIESYWIRKAVRSKEEAHQAAHLLEHHVSEQVLDNIRMISMVEREGVPLSEFRAKEGMITNILLKGGRFERLISMGFSPGEKVTIINKLPNSVIIMVKNKKIAIDRKLAGKIRVLEQFIENGKL